MKERIVSRKTILDDFFNVEKWEYQYEKEDGTLTPVVDRLLVRRQDCAAVLIFNTDSKTVVMTKQFRHCTYDKGPGWMIEAAAGKLDEGESPEEAMRRESIEETGYKLNKLHKVATVYSSPGYTTERMHIYYAEVTDADHVDTGGGLAEEGEYIENVTMTLEEFKQALDSDAIPDSKTLIAGRYLLARNGY